MSDDVESTSQGRTARLAQLLEQLAARGVKQREVAFELNLPTQYLSDLKHGRRPVSEPFARRFAEAMGVIAIANNTGATTFAQYGAIAALSPEGDLFRIAMRERCRAGREVVQQFLDRQNRIRWIAPGGAFYGFLHIDGLSDSLGFAQNLVRNQRVGVAPGSAFCPPDDRVSDSYVRICFAQDPVRLSEGLSRIERALSSL